MKASDLTAWIASRGLSHRGAAKALDVSGNRLYRFLDGSVRIPEHIALACAAISHPLPPWRAR
jgi:plasmid maintenance system antidote protein VapI